MLISEFIFIAIHNDTKNQVHNKDELMNETHPNQ